MLPHLLLLADDDCIRRSRYRPVGSSSPFAISMRTMTNKGNLLARMAFPPVTEGPFCFDVSRGGPLDCDSSGF
jgi:hypothetical protein